MTDQNDTENVELAAGGPHSLDDTMHALKNCLSMASSGCLLIDDALNRQASCEIREIVVEMREAIQRAVVLSREIPALAAGKQEP